MLPIFLFDRVLPRRPQLCIIVMYQALSGAQMIRHLQYNSKIIKLYCAGCSLYFIAAGFAGAFYTGEAGTLLADFVRLLSSPSKDATDYFGYGSLGAAYLNAGLCGLAVIAAVILLKAEAGASIMTGYFLVLSHAFYGKNLLNIMPCMLGTFVALQIRKKKPKELLHICIFSSCFGPLISELLFRYTLAEFSHGVPSVSAKAALLAAGCSLAVGLLFPLFMDLSALLTRGYSLYNAGLAGGLLGGLIYLLLYRLTGRELPGGMEVLNPAYESAGRSFAAFANIVFIVFFAATLLIGRSLNGGSFKGYEKLLYAKEGVHAERWGMPHCLINIGFYGFFLLAVYDIIIFTGKGVGFTAPTTGAVIAALSFACTAQSPANTWPVFVGYALFSVLGLLSSGVWLMATQPFLSSMAFATGLCPVVQRRGRVWGVIAGFLCAAICIYPKFIHGGLMIYNGGFTSGIIGCLMMVLFIFLDRLTLQEDEESHDSGSEQ